jgi:hypothetical protein
MDPEVFNMSVRKFLKVVGVTSQREIEQAVARGVEAGTISGGQTLDATMTLSIPALGLTLPISGEITLGLTPQDRLVD